MDSKSVKVKLEGYCCKNYQPVKEHLQKMLNSGGEENVQLCVYVKDKCVVDLYGTAIGMYAAHKNTVSLRSIVSRNINDNHIMCLYFHKNLR